MNIIELKHVTKMYGKSRGVLDISLSVPKGSVFGFLGPNGAGKSTTINMLVNLIRATEGKIKLFGKDVEASGIENRARIGYLSGEMALDNTLTGWQQLEYFGALRGMFDKEYVLDLAHRLDINLHIKIKRHSRGNRQKIALIAALMHKPELLILDEPTNGLDPLVQNEFNKIILSNKKEGKTTFISSHILSEVEGLCDQVAIIREGRIIADKSLRDLISEAPKKVHITDSDEDMPPAIAKLKGVTNQLLHDHSVSFTYNGDVNELIATVSKHKLLNMTISNSDLEEVFMRYYEGKHDA